MNVIAMEPPRDAGHWLAGAQFADAFSVTVDDATLDARHAAERAFGRSPRWVEALLSLRDMIMAPFGVTTTTSVQRSSANRIGIFPVISETPERVVAGFDDSHLDFRVLIDVAPSGNGQRITATTLVLTHNWLGRIYLTIILPFHRLVARAMLRQVAS